MQNVVISVDHLPDLGALAAPFTEQDAELGRLVVALRATADGLLQWEAYCSSVGRRLITVGRHAPSEHASWCHENAALMFQLEGACAMVRFGADYVLGGVLAVQSAPAEWRPAMAYFAHSLADVHARLDAAGNALARVETALGRAFELIEPQLAAEIHDGLDGEKSAALNRALYRHAFDVAMLEKL